MRGEAIAAGLVVGGIGLALGAQLAVAQGATMAGGLGLLAAAGLTAAGARAPQLAAALPGASMRLLGGQTRLVLSLGALLAGGSAFALSTGNRYTLPAVLLWLVAVFGFLLVNMDYRRVAPGSPLRAQGLRACLRTWLTRERVVVLVLLLGVLALGAAFRFVALADNPRDMNSDQAEKLLDVGDVLAGQPYIFFERNTGREPWQFYWTVGLIRIFGLQPDFLALKLGTSLISWLMLPAVFLLGREVFGTRAALLATLFAAVASWGVIPGRFGLRYPLAPCATAWTLFFLVRGLRRDSRNSLLLAGLWMGIGLQGYTAYRFMLVVVPLLGLIWLGWLLLKREYAAARRVVVGGLLAAVLTLLCLAPLLRYGFERPDQLFYRATTRLTSQERPIEGDPGQILLDNICNVLLMFNYTRDEVWVVNIPEQPAMDVVLAGLLVVGAAGCLGLSWRTRNPWPALTLLAGGLMLMPSALSIAFPRENPSIVRTGGALPILMIVCAAAPGILLALLHEAARDGKAWQQQLVGGATGGVVALGLLVAVINWQRVFVDYPAQYCPRAQNASDIAAELLVWEQTGGERSAAWLVGYPHWVDARAVGIWIGEINFPNVVMGAEEVARVDLGGRPGWFVLNREDLPVLQALFERYPDGHERLVEGSQCAGRAFVVFETQPQR